jgi:quinolinate synthase
MNKPQSEKAEILKKIEITKARLGKDLIVLAHYYQNDDIIRYADFIGDSLQLAREASRRRDARYIVFCAVSFMAEMARILCLPRQDVFHPDPDARCPLADMAGIEMVENAWKNLKALNKKIVPVVYVNSNANLKAFCGRNGGFVCTSANADKVFGHVFSQGASVLFFPDENLGRNTAYRLGIKNDEIFLWDTAADVKHLDVKNMEKAKVFLWKGYCYVHTKFLPSDIINIRNKQEGIRIAVHPECVPEVVFLSDFSGSTSFIKDVVEKSESGSKWAIGTELNFVNRIKNDNPDKTIMPINESVCSDMSKITPENLLRVLEGLIENAHFGKVTVDTGTARDAKIALDRMLEIG